ncbi:DUF551 domain-containing protein [Novosphingobium sp. RL4]|uniref:DUF551 domain-containing protein n=1 Tax=Novosphingobium sp. RL4 TaxID=3109595 RepID=UPI002D79F6DC|nr:DUF551 domain-containing protein [Novosphingobium sp. RL4]WRT91875.1 DUF551 domain-containing protein [Novosphingobium sp. RL4]
MSTTTSDIAAGEKIASLVEAMQGISHFRDAVSFRADPLSVALRQWIDAGEEALAAVENPDGPVPAKWQPIETAPKDGSGIIVIDMTAPLPEAGQAWFKHGVWTAVCPDGAIALEAEVYRAMAWPTPTHWMPLPSAPSQIEEGKDNG